MVLVLTPIVGIPMIEPGDELADIIMQALHGSGLRMEDGDILVLAQKIVSKSENRFVNLSEVVPSRRARDLAKETNKDLRLVEMILRESQQILRSRIARDRSSQTSCAHSS